MVNSLFYFLFYSSERTWKTVVNVIRSFAGRMLKSMHGTPLLN